MTSAIRPRSLLDLARAQCLKICGSIECDGSFVGGSVSDGLGHSLSDFDIYVINPTLRSERTQLGDGHRWHDLHPLQVEDVLALLSELDAARLTRTPRPTLLPDESLTLLVQLAHGQPVTGASALAGMQELLCARTDALRRQLVFRWAARAHSLLEDAIGLSADGDDLSALLVARSTLIASMKCLLSSQGDMTMGEKWVLRQMMRTFGGVIPVTSVVNLVAGRNGDVDPASEVDSLLSWIGAALAGASCLGWSGVDLQAVSNWTSVSSGCHRTRGLYARPFEECVVLTAPTKRQVRLNHQSALVWALCDGRSERQIESVARSCLQESRLSDDQPDFDIGRCLDLLHARGLIQRG